MPNLGPLPRKSDTQRGTSAGHRCARCREDLHLVGRHVSPSRLGTPLVTEFYQCGACDSGFAFTPATGKWKVWATDED